MASKKEKSVFSLAPSELAISKKSSASGGSASARVSRAESVRSETLRIEHIPTGEAVEGEIPSGNYTRKEMQLARANLELKLISVLTEKVAKKLRLAGRS